MGINEIRPALEAILFAAGDSVETERIAKILGAEPWDARHAAEQLPREYEQNGAKLTEEQLKRQASELSQLSEEELLASGIKPNTVRLSIGTEHIDDILDDLRHGFDEVRA